MLPHIQNAHKFYNVHPILLYVNKNICYVGGEPEEFVYSQHVPLTRPQLKTKTQPYAFTVQRKECKGNVSVDSSLLCKC